MKKHLIVLSVIALATNAFGENNPLEIPPLPIKRKKPARFLGIPTTLAAQVDYDPNFDSSGFPRFTAYLDPSLRNQFSCTFSAETTLEQSRSPLLRSSNRDQLARDMIRSPATAPSDLNRLLFMGLNLEKVEDGKTLLMLAAENGKPEMMKALIEAGANTNGTDAQGNTAGHLILSGIGRIQKNSLQRPKTADDEENEKQMIKAFQILNPNAYEINRSNNSGETVLEMISRSPYDKLHSVLEQMGAKDREGNQPGRYHAITILPEAQDKVLPLEEPPKKPSSQLQASIQKGAAEIKKSLSSLLWWVTGL